MKYVRIIVWFLLAVNLYFAFTGSIINAIAAAIMLYQLLS